ncbi:MAG TPA: hypothetical protein VMO88_14215 [Acidimicrobiales bacterium]|nr:hypothetical protein [Acidimicrobiales bacterium]
MPAVPELLARVEERVKIDPHFAEALEAFVDAPHHGAGSYSRTAADEINSARRRQAVDEFRAGSLTTAEVQRLLGLGTPQAVHRLRSRGKLIGLQSGNATWFPSWQFAEGQIRKDLARILEVLSRFTSDPVASDRAVRMVRDDLGGRSISSALDDRRWSAAAWNALSELAG